MAYKLVTKSNNNKLIFFIVIGLLILWYYFGKSKSENFDLFADKSDYICSKKCCHIGWETPVKINDDRIKDGDIGTKYLSSNINCNDGILNTGCICLPNS